MEWGWEKSGKLFGGGDISAVSSRMNRSFPKGQMGEMGKVLGEYSSTEGSLNHGGYG